MEKVIRHIAALVLAGLICHSPVAKAEGGPTAVEYGVVYGDGLRHLAEGTYDEAIRHLFRAYGMRQEAEVMRLIVEAYDGMGHCDAATRQARFFERMHREAENQPKLGRCRVTGELVVDCGLRGYEEVFVNGMVRGRCGEVLTLPAGEDLMVSLEGRRSPRQVRLEVYGREHLDLRGEERFAQVTRLPGLEGHVERLPSISAGEHRQAQARVPRLSVPTAAYSVFQSEDGIYQLWMRRSGNHSSESEDGEAPPRVEIICPDEAPDGEVEAGCLWLRELRRRSTGSPDNPQRFEVVVPRMP